MLIAQPEDIHEPHDRHDRHDRHVRQQNAALNIASLSSAALRQVRWTTEAASTAARLFTTVIRRRCTFISASLNTLYACARETKVFFKTTVLRREYYDTSAIDLNISSASSL